MLVQQEVQADFSTQERTLSMQESVFTSIKLS